MTQAGARREWTQLSAVDWNLEAKTILKAELKRRNMAYVVLRQNLERMGVTESDANLRNKISRGSFTAAFFLQCLAAMGCDTLRLGDLYSARQM